ncbi:MAG TPA: hypothetical protein VI282_19445 [Verrucomicrobiae bacterium]|jgi:Arc/MetJ-type ribon-helix-helix transcriptional regulator
MQLTIEITPDVEKWLNGKVQSGSISSAGDYVSAALQRDYLEEQLEDAMREPATPLTDKDWATLRREVAQSISRQK